MNGFTKFACVALIAGVGTFGGEAQAQNYGNPYSTPAYAPAANYGYNAAPCNTGNSWGQVITRPITSTANWLGQAVSPLFGGTSSNQSYYRPVNTGYATQPQTICGPNGCYVPASTTNCPGGVCPTPTWPTTYTAPNYQGYSTPGYQGYTLPGHQTTPAYYTPPAGSYYGTGATVPVNYQSTGTNSPFYN